MKKFFGKKGTLISFAIASVVFLGGLLAMLLSPVFYAGSYSGGSGDEFFDYKQSIHFKSSNKFEAKSVATRRETGKTTTTVTEYWYYRQGDVVFALGSTKETTKAEYKERVEAIKDLDKDQYDLLVETQGMEINWKTVRMQTITGSFRWRNKTSLPLVIVDAILMAIALAGTGLSAFYYVKGGKKKSKSAK